MWWIDVLMGIIVGGILSGAFVMMFIMRKRRSALSRPLLIEEIYS